MKPTPSPLKWMAEKRARIAAELATAAEQATQAVELAAQATELATTLTEKLAALDRVITIYSPSLDPTLIAPVHGWQGRYGKRGALRDTLMEVLRDRAPESITTADLETHATKALGVRFHSPAERRRWYQNSLRNTLKKLEIDGFVEREVGWVPGSNAMGSWRWKQAKPMTLADLRGLAP